MRPNGSPQELEHRRLRAMEMIKKGMFPVEVARHMGVDRRSVRRWKAIYRIKGIQGLKAKPAPGRPHVYTHRREQKVAKGTRIAHLSF